MNALARRESETVNLVLVKMLNTQHLINKVVKVVRAFLAIDYIETS